MTTYVSGSRRSEELMTEARRLSYQENYSYTEGWDDNTLIGIFNLGLNRLYKRITEINNPNNIEEQKINIVAAQQAYDIPIDVFFASRIVDVRFVFGSQEWEFVKLVQGMIQDRVSYPTTLPATYAIRNGQMLLSPTPSVTKTDGLIINYQKRMRKLDIRRGKVTSYTKDASNKNVKLTLNFTVVSDKDTNMQSNGESILDKIDYCCLVDRQGTPIVDAISLQGYTASTTILTAEPAYAISTTEAAALDAAISAGTTVYVVEGDYSSTHSELDRQSEDFLIEYAVLRLLRLQSAAEPTKDQLDTEEAVLKSLTWAYRRTYPAVRKIVWDRTHSTTSSLFGGRY